LDALPGAAERPGLAAGALAMAKILDNPLAVPQQPGGSRAVVLNLERVG
jgi:hypothetical protein